MRAAAALQIKVLCDKACGDSIFIYINERLDPHRFRMRWAFLFRRRLYYKWCHYTKRSSFPCQLSSRFSIRCSYNSRIQASIYAKFHLLKCTIHQGIHQYQRHFYLFMFLLKAQQICGNFKQKHIQLSMCSKRFE